MWGILLVIAIPVAILLVHGSEYVRENYGQQAGTTSLFVGLFLVIIPITKFSLKLFKEEDERQNFFTWERFKRTQPKNIIDNLIETGFYQEQEDKYKKYRGEE